LKGEVATLISLVEVDFRCTVSFSLLRSCLAKITTTDNAFQFSKVIKQNIVVSFLEAVRDNVVYNDVTITSSVVSVHDTIRNKCYIFVVK